MSDSDGMQPFWTSLSLTQMSHSEWESLCDGCGRCCLHKLQCEDSGEVYYTDVACRNLDCSAGGCLDYRNRQTLVPECLVLKPEDIETFYWLPATCAYRLVAEGKSLPIWHPLLTDDSESVVRAGISVRGRVVMESSVNPDDLEERVIHWIS